MAYVLDPARSVHREVRRVARERLGDALQLLSDLDGTDADAVEQAVHAVRKRCKEVRALARLVRTALGDEFDRFNALVRDAADELAPIRDAHAALATFDDLLARHRRIDDADLGVIRDAQVAAAEAASSGVRGSDPRIERACDLLRAARKRVKRWDISEGFAVLEAGVEVAYRRGRREMRRALAEPTEANVHAWRTSAKHLWYQMRLLEQAAPSVLSPLVAGLDDLAEALGDDHDLAVLGARWAADPAPFGGPQRVAIAQQLISTQHLELCERAFRLGATIYVESPGAFRRRIAAYWATAVDLGPELAVGGIAELTAAERVSESVSPVAGPATSTVERERKFLVPLPPPVVGEGTELRQGYLAIDESVSVRVRDAGVDGCTLTIKAGRGAVRTELEWPITAPEFCAAWEHTGGRRIHKTRHRLDFGGRSVDLDVFHDELDGLVLAEVEFDSDEEMASFVPMAWMGREVTDDVTYTNASLAVHPPDPFGVRHRTDH